VRWREWLLPLAIGLALVVIQACGPELASAWRYERSAIATHEWWRLLTGHLVHKPLLGDLARLLALVGSYAADEDLEHFERAAGYVMEVAKAPPLIVGDSPKFHLIHVCLD